jgi:dihydrodipicolinate synthase/N-acetylneuraminate lyase
MKRSFSATDTQGVFPVPPLARHANGALNIEANRKIVDHIAASGITRLIYGGNAFLYHVTLAEYEELLGWLTGLPDQLLCVPSAGPSFGRAIDQAPLLRRAGFPIAMLLPCSDPRDAAGLERGIRAFADAAGMPVMAYLKDETNFGADREAGLDAVARLVKDGVCIAIKYAVVRKDPGVDPYLRALLQRVDAAMVISGIGERPAVVHMRDWGLPGFTTGSGCVAPALSQALFEACRAGRFEEAQAIRERFLPLEDRRDQWGPARVLHAAVEVAGVAPTGPIPPFVSPLEADRLADVAGSLNAFQALATSPSAL